MLFVHDEVGQTSGRERKYFARHNAAKDKYWIAMKIVLTTPIGSVIKDNYDI